MHVSVQKESTQEKTFSLWGQSGRQQGQAVWRCCAVFIPRDIQNQIRHSPGHPAPLQQRSWRRSQEVLLHFRHSVILWNITWRIPVISDLSWAMGCGVPRIPQLRDLCYWILWFNLGGQLSTTQTLSALLSARGDRIERVKVQGVVGWDKSRQIQPIPEE